jgi:hypothetical protein
MIPSNAGYYEAAYIAAAVIYVGYALTIVLRTRALRARLRAARQETDAPE